MAVPSFTGELGAGLQLGLGGAKVVDDRRQAKLGAQQRELLGGLRRTSLGLGGETPQQQAQARLQLLSQDPEGQKLFLGALDKMDESQEKQARETNKMIGTVSSNLLQFADKPDQLKFATLEAAKGFSLMGRDDLALKTQQLANLPANELKAQLQGLEAFAIDAETFFDQRQPKAEGEGRFSKGTEFLTKDEDGNLILNTSTFNQRTGQTEIKKSPVNEKLVNKMGEDVSEQTLREIEVEGGKAGAAAKSKLAVKTADDAIKQVVTIDQNLKDLDQGIAALEGGANIGIIDSFTPSIKDATIRLDNIRKKLGLGVVGSVTFGALSKAELDIAMETAVPKFNNSDDALAWFKERRNAQNKLRDFYFGIAEKASKENKTFAEIIVEMEKEQAEKEKNPKSAKDVTQMSDDELFK